jgi:hypothetical protein
VGKTHTPQRIFNKLINENVKKHEIVNAFKILSKKHTPISAKMLATRFQKKFKKCLKKEI